MAGTTTKRDLTEHEILEDYYFNQIKFYIYNNKEKIKKIFEFKSKIIGPWIDNSLPWNLCDIIDGKYGMYETYNAYIIIQFEKSDIMFNKKISKPVFIYRIEDTFKSSKVVLSLIKDNISVIEENIRLDQ